MKMSFLFNINIKYYSIKNIKLNEFENLYQLLMVYTIYKFENIHIYLINLKDKMIYI